MQNNGGFDKLSMILVREYSTTNKKQLELKEHKYIVKLKATLNYRIPTRTPEQYRETNKQFMNQRKKEYYKVNKDVILNRNKEYREQTNKLSTSKRKIITKTTKL
jgi:hypothetical protein